MAISRDGALAARRRAEAPEGHPGGDMMESDVAAGAAAPEGQNRPANAPETQTRDYPEQQTLVYEKPWKDKQGTWWWRDTQWTPAAWMWWSWKQNNWMWRDDSGQWHPNWPDNQSGNSDGDSRWSHREDWHAGWGSSMDDG